MTSLIDSQIKHVYDRWHETVRARNLSATASLYAEEAVLETPLLLAMYPDRQSGVMVGRDNIRKFFEESVRRFSSDLAQWFRTDVAFVNGRKLTWEYPRATPNGEQVDLMEMMEIEDGFIAAHRVYWGWYGVRLLTPALAAAMPAIKGQG
jgi:steroid Delta-isomerase